VLPLIRLSPIVALALAAICAGPASASMIIYADPFDTSSALWGNEFGDWTTSEGSFYSQSPTNDPLTYSLLPFIVTDFAVELDIGGPNDGGIYLRANPDRSNAVLLMFGGIAHTGTGLYWHVGPDYETIVNPTSEGLFTHDDRIHLRIVVTGNVYQVFLNGSPNPVTTLVDNSVSSGRVGLYDFTGAAGGQTLDNFVLETVPESSTLAMAIVGLGLVAIGRARRRKL
jgi:hypothetical protein